MNKNRATALKLLLILSIAALVGALFYAFGGERPRFASQPAEEGGYGPPQLEYRPISYEKIPGWRRDDQSKALDVFIRSCDAMAGKDDASPANPLESLGQRAGGVSLAGSVGDWRAACTAARAFVARAHAGPNALRASARIFFENNFAPVQIIEWRAPLADGPARNKPPSVEDAGLFTGYFEPVYEASGWRTLRFSAPLFARPTDLVEVDLGAFREDLSGRRVAGRVKDGRLVPYADHKEINGGALDGVAAPLAWLDPNDLFFLQIQGSGRLVIGQDRTIRVGYAAQNGHPYTAVGKVMRERGIMELADISMQSIRAWLDAAPANEARSMREENASYVFFNELDLGGDLSLGPLGAQGVSLTPERSIAVDRRFHAMGAPVWVDLDPINGDPEGSRFQQLLIAQDTGGAIRGPIRGDIYWGGGPRAGEIAGKMRSKGSMYVLVPRSVARKLRARFGS